MTNAEDAKSAEATLKQHAAGTLEDWEDVKGMLLTAQDRFMQGFCAGVLTLTAVLVVAVILWSVST